MSTPQWARDKDRDAAIKLVEAAWANGQIVEADRDKRVEELQRAETLAEVQMLTHDLQPAAPSATPFVTPVAPQVAPETAAPGPAAAPPPYPPVEYGPPVVSSPALDAAAAKKVSKAVLVVPLVVVAVVAVGIVGGVVALVKGVDSTVSSSGGIFDNKPVDVLSVSGYQDLVDAVREQSGSTTAFSAVLYPTYAVVELPVDTTTQHESYWYWDGHELTSNDTKSSASYPRTDLADLDPQVLVDLVRKVRKKMSDESSWYAIVRAPDDQGAVVWAYASNEYGDSVYMGAKPDGTITWDSTKH